MAYAQELKNLVAEIKTGHRDRRVRISGIKRETRDILKGADDYMERVAAELKDMARDLRGFLAKSEETRKRDFNVMMGEIQAKIKETKGYIKNFLAHSGEKRMADFRAMMKDITSDVARARRTVGTLLGEYGAERKEAAGYLASLPKREAAPAEAAPAEELPAEEERPKAKKKEKK